MKYISLLSLLLLVSCRITFRNESVQNTVITLYTIDTCYICSERYTVWLNQKTPIGNFNTLEEANKCISNQK